MTKSHLTTRIDSIVADASAPVRRRTRGMAIMLVIFCVAAVTIMAAAYAVSRENAPQLTGNVVSGSTARMAASAGLSMANAVLECNDADWRDTTVGGVLFSDYPVGEGTVTVTLTDVKGGLPTPDTMYVNIKAVGKHNGMEQVAEAVAYVARDQPKADPTFSEFAIFGTDHVEVADSLITRWDQSPKASLGLPLWLGTNAQAGSNIVLSGSTQLVDPQVVATSNVAAVMVRDSRPTPEPVRVESPAADKMLPTPIAATADTSGCSLSPTPVVNITGGSVLSSESWILTSVRIADAGKVRVNSSSLVTRWVQGNVTIENGGVLIVETDHDFVIDGDLIIRNGSGINVNDGVRCRIFLGGNLLVDHGALGVSLARASTVLNPRDGLGLYKPPSECKVYQKPGALGGTWTIDNASVIVAQMYAPAATVTVRNNSCYMGSILGKNVALAAGSVLHYDHKLDQRGGFTNLNSPLYNADGSLNTDLLALATDLNDSTIDAVNSTLTPIATGPTPFGSPNPRKRHVNWRMRRFGINTVWDRDRFAAVGDANGTRP